MNEIFVIPVPLASDPITIIASDNLSTSPTTSLPPPLDGSPSSSSDPSASMPSTPTNSNPFPIQHSSSSNVVPAYPYNVSMLPQTHNGPTPDDSGISTRLPSICVDYLSHNWSEEDVWTRLVRVLPLLPSSFFSRRAILSLQTFRSGEKCSKFLF